MIRIIAVVCVLMLSGCSYLTGQGDYSYYTEALTAHSANEASRISNQSQAIVDLANESVKKSQTPAEAALQAAFATLAIGQLHPQPLPIVKPTTGMDVLNTGVAHIPFVASTYGMLRLGKAGIAAAGNIAIGDNANITNSFNPAEIHATGSGNMVTTTGTAEPTVVMQPEPIIVQ
jgi:hypothetical protein